MKTKKPSLRFCTCHLSDALYQIDCVILCEISIIKYHFSYLEYGMSRKIVEDYLCTLYIFMEKDSMEASGRRRSETYKCQQLFVFASNDERTLCFGKQMMYLYGKTTFFFQIESEFVDSSCSFVECLFSEYLHAVYGGTTAIVSYQSFGVHIKLSEFIKMHVRLTSVQQFIN